MRSTDLSQIVIRPSEATPELLAAATAAIEREPYDQIGLMTKIRITLAGIVHPIGVHHWVKYKTYDPMSDRIIIWPDRWVCSECPKGRIIR